MLNVAFIHHNFGLRATVSCYTYNLCGVSKMGFPEKNVFESQRSLFMVLEFYYPVEFIEVTIWPLDFQIAFK